MKTRNPGAVIRTIATQYDRDMSYLVASYRMLAPVDRAVTSWDEQAIIYAQFAAMQDACQDATR